LSVEKGAKYALKLDEMRGGAQTAKQVLAIGNNILSLTPVGIMYSMTCGYKAHQCHTKLNYGVTVN